MKLKPRLCWRHQLTEGATLSPDLEPPYLFSPLLRMPFLLLSCWQSLLFSGHGLSALCSLTRVVWPSLFQPRWVIHSLHLFIHPLAFIRTLITCVSLFLDSKADVYALLLTESLLLTLHSWLPLQIWTLRAKINSFIMSVKPRSQSYPSFLKLWAFWIILLPLWPQTVIRSVVLILVFKKRDCWRYRS